MKKSIKTQSKREMLNVLFAPDDINENAPFWIRDRVHTYNPSWDTPPPGFRAELKKSHNSLIKWIKNTNLPVIFKRIERADPLDIHHAAINGCVGNLFIYYFLELSFDRYEPKRSFRVLCRWLKQLKYNKQIEYGSTSRFHSSERYAIKTLLELYSDYLLLNEDWASYEAFALKCRDNNSEYFYMEACVIISLETKKNADYRLISRAILKFDHSRSLKESVNSKLSECISSNIFINEYVKKNDRKQLNKLMDQVCLEYQKSDPKWFYKSLLQHVPSKYLRSKDPLFRRSLHADNSPRLFFPTAHIFTKLGAPNTHEIYLRILCKDIINEFYNRIRDACGVPRIGEGWIGEANLLRKVRNWFPKDKIVHQWTPPWLGRQRIDIAIPKYQIAIEYHGTQHFKPIDYFGGKEAFKTQQVRDSLKASLCADNLVQLFVFTENDSDKDIRKILKRAVELAKKNR